MRNLFLRTGLAALALFGALSSQAQTNIFPSETIGAGGNGTAIASFTGYTNNGTLTFTGTGDIRNTNASSGYTGATGGGNVLLNGSNETFQIAGINTTGYTNITLSFGARKNTNAETGSTLALEYSTDGTSYTPLTIPTFPTGTGTATWHLRTATGTIPATTNLRLRWRQAATSDWRLDDMTLTGTPPPTPSINTPSGAVTSAFGNITQNAAQPVNTQSIAGSNLTANIVATVASGDYSVHNGDGVWASSATFTQTGGNASGTLSIRYNSVATLGTNNGTINVTSTGATTRVITTTGQTVGSSVSDVATQGTFTPANNIDYTGWQSGTITSQSNSIAVQQIVIRDGGATPPDADALPTRLTAITFGVTGGNFIRAASLFSGQTHLADAVVTGGNTITFTGLTGNDFRANDNGDQMVVLRVTFLSTVTDNAQLAYTVTSVTAGSSTTSSQFAAANGGGAVSTTTGNRNRLEVTADRIAIGTQPITGGVNASIPFTIILTDSNDNVDLDATKSVNVTTSGTGVSGIANPYSLTGGSLNITGIQFSALQTGITFTATTTGYIGGNNTATSTTFNIGGLAPITNDYRTTSNGIWNPGGTSTATFERFNGTNWNSNAAPGLNVSNRVFIRHAVTGSGSFSPKKVIIENNGTFTNGDQMTVSDSLIIEDGGQLSTFAAFDIGASGLLVVKEGGVLQTGYDGATLSSSLFAGSERFEEGSLFRVVDFNTASGAFPYLAVDSNDFGNGFALFGDVELDLASSGIGSNQFLMPTGFSSNLAHGNFTVTTMSTSFAFRNGGSAFVGIRGNLILNAPANEFRNSTGTAKTHVKVYGDVIINAGTYAPTAGNGSGIATTLDIEGDLLVNGGLLNMNQTSFTPTVQTVTINLMRDLTVASGASISNAGTSAITFYDVNFNGTTLQTFTSAGTVQRFEMNVLNGATVQLGSNIAIGANTNFNIATGGILNFAFTGSTPNTMTGNTSGLFVVNNGAKVIVTSPDGLNGGSNGSANLGNVLGFANGNRTFSQAGGATYEYAGTSAQVIGDLFSSGSTDKIVIINNPTTVSLSEPIGISNTLRFLQGTLTETLTNTISGGGALQMAGGQYNMVETGTTLPRLTGTYTLPGGMIGLIGAGNQVLRGSRTYNGVEFGGSGIKTVTSAISDLDTLVLLSGSATFDQENNTFEGDAALTLGAGTRFRASRLNTVLPTLTGTLTAASTSTVELYGSSSTQTHSLRSGGSEVYGNLEFKSTGLNDGIDAANVVIGDPVSVTGTATVFAGTSLKVSGPNGDLSGAGNLTTQSNTILKVGNSNGFQGFEQLAGTVNIDPSTSLAFIGSTATNTGNQLALFDTVSVEKGIGFVATQNDAGLPNVLRFRRGHYGLGNFDYDLTVQNAVGYSSTSYFVTAGSGALIANVDNVIPTQFFVGATGSSFNPATIAFDNGTQNLNFSVRAISGVFTNGLTGAPLASDAVNATWDISALGALDSAVNVTLQWNATDELPSFNRTSAGIGHYTQLAWDIGTLGNCGGIRTVVGNGPYSMSRCNIKSFSPFGVGDPQSVLPVTLTRFTARAEANAARLDWATASETNSDFFAIERSSNGTDFTQVGQVAAAGRSVSNLTYSFIDENVATAMSVAYYRLRQVDVDGTSAFSQVRQVAFANQGLSIAAVFPQHAVTEAFVDVVSPNAGQLTLALIDAMGRNVYAQNVTVQAGLQRISLNVEGLAKGVYTLRASNRTAVSSIRFIK